MELRHLRYFVAVAEELNYGRAADRLHISRPPLTVQIKQLEKEVGTEFFRRTSRGLLLSDAGRVFLEQARKTLAQAERGIALARQAASGEAGELTIGYNPVAAHRIFPHVVGAFRKLRPDINLIFRSLRTPEQVEALARNDLDLGFVCPPVPEDTLDMQILTQQPFVALLPQGHRLAGAPVITFEALANEPLIVYSRMLDPDSFRQIEREFHTVGAIPKVAYELESAHAMIGFVAAGNGCCIVPEYVGASCQGGVVCKPLEPPNVVRVLAIATKKDRGGLAEAFCQFAVAHVHEMYAQPWPLRTQARAALPRRALRTVLARSR